MVKNQVEDTGHDQDVASCSLDEDTFSEEMYDDELTVILRTYCPETTGD